MFRAILVRHLRDRPPGLIPLGLGLLCFDLEAIDLQADPRQIRPAGDSLLEGLLLPLCELIGDGELLGVHLNCLLQARQTDLQPRLFLVARPLLVFVPRLRVGEPRVGAAELRPQARPLGRAISHGRRGDHEKGISGMHRLSVADPDLRDDSIFECTHRINPTHRYEHESS